MAFELLCMTLIGLLFGLAVVFFGYRMFLILLPIWGFFFGLGLGAHTVQLIFGTEFLATITSWVVGFLVGLIFAVLSYLFYIVGVAILSASAGYWLAVSILGAIGLGYNFIVWVIGIIAAVILAYVVLRFNLQKYAIIVITAAGGTAAIILTLLAAFGQVSLADIAGNPVMAAMSHSFLWTIFFIVVAVAGIVVQLRANRSYEVESYNRWA